MKKIVPVCIGFFGIATFGLFATGCTPKPAEETSGSASQSVPPAPTPNPKVEDKRADMMPGGGPPKDGGAPAPK